MKNRTTGIKAMKAVYKEFENDGTAFFWYDGKTSP